LTKIGSRWMMLQTATAFQTFRDHADTERRMHRIGTIIVKRWGRKDVGRAWLTWHESVKEIGRLRRISTKIISRWGRMTVSPAFLRWQESLAEYKHMTRLLTKIGSRWMMLQAALAFRIWTDTSAHTQYLTRYMKVVARRMVRVNTGRAFVTWHNRLAYMQDCLGNSAYYRSKRSIRDATERWKLHLRMTLRHRDIAARIMGRWQKLPLAIAFEDWKQHDKYYISEAMFRYLVSQSVPQFEGQTTFQGLL